MAMALLHRLGLIAISSGLMAISASTIPTVTAQESSCNFAASGSLRKTQKYGIFGNDEFETLVCGYLVTRQETVWDEPVNNAYFRIVKFSDAGFRQAIKAGIEQGNRVNTIRQGQYEFNLGCFKNNAVHGQQHNPKQAYMTSGVNAKLRQSSEQQPIVLKLSFGKHRGSECVCCNLAHAVRTGS
jgi:hypothetical protein